MEGIEDILRFWFGDGSDDAEVAARQSTLWWSKDAAVDRAIAERFAGCVTRAATQALDDWAATARGRLALILLTDQFPRNMYRDTPQAFAFDAMARAWCKDGLREGADRLLRPIERVFFYLPLEHSEALADQQQSVTLFARLRDEVPVTHRPVFAGFLDYAQRHRDVVQRFGRFPHRNRILGRVSTADEQLFLRQPGSSF